VSILLVLLSLLTFSWSNLLAQSKTQETTRQNVSLTGTTFDEKLFVSDTDMKIWTVTNPTVLKGHAGHHVRITAQLDTANNVLVVKSIKVMAAEHRMPTNDDFELNILPEPFPNYLRRREVPIK
jgi:hypothetical protein